MQVSQDDLHGMCRENRYQAQAVSKVACVQLSDCIYVRDMLGYAQVFCEGLNTKPHYLDGNRVVVVGKKYDKWTVLGQNETFREKDLSHNSQESTQQDMDSLNSDSSFQRSVN